MQFGIGGIANSKGYANEYLKVEDGVGMTEGKVYWIGPGFVTEAIPNAEMGIPCVAIKTSASGDMVMVGVRGVFSMWLKTGTLTAGDAVRADNSEGLAVTTGGAATDNPGDSAADEIGVIVTGGSGGSNDSEVLLYGFPVTSIA